MEATLYDKPNRKINISVIEILLYLNFALRNLNLLVSVGKGRK